MLTRRQQHYLDAMGIEVWLDRHTSPDAAPDSITPAVALPQDTASTPTVPDVSQLGWSGLRQQVVACRRCELHQTRTQTVFGVGNEQADLLIIGEAPGAEEDRQGEPFVGRAGLLLNNMLKAIGLERRQVYIANILKCRPPGNRDPKPEEAAQCTPYLLRQIDLVQPKLILALGRIAAQRLLNTNTSLARLRGKVHQIDKVTAPIVVTYHPAYLLRSPTEKRKAWEDLLYATTLINSA